MRRALLRVDILTLFPDLFSGFVSESVLKLAMQRGLVDLHRWDFRAWARDKHNKVDDRPYGGGPGMVLACQPVFDAVEAVRGLAEPEGRLILLTPRGRRLTQPLVEQLSREPRLILLCGRYEGFDERVSDGLGPLEISVGDFVCNGGEVPAMLLIEAVMRLIPGVLGDDDSAREESHCEPGWLEYPQYTRPPVFRDMEVPEVLLSGDHGAIRRWRQQQAKRRSEPVSQDEGGRDDDGHPAAPGEGPGKQSEIGR